MSHPDGDNSIQLRRWACIQFPIIGIVSAVAMILIFGSLAAAAALILVALVIASIGFRAPEKLRPLHSLLATVAVGIASILTLALLTLVYYLVITPYGCILRLLGSDSMQRKRSPNESSYWCERPGPTSKSSYFRQF